MTVPNIYHGCMDDVMDISMTLVSQVQIQMMMVMKSYEHLCLEGTQHYKKNIYIYIFIIKWNQTHMWFIFEWNSLSLARFWVCTYLVIKWDDKCRIIVFSFYISKLTRLIFNFILKIISMKWFSRLWKFH